MKLTAFEARRVLTSLLFWLVVAALLISVGSQFMETEAITPPQPDQVDYGTKVVNDLIVIYPNLISDLIASIENNYFIAYPFGFYRLVDLPPESLAILKDLLSQVTGLPYETLKSVSQAELKELLGRQELPEGASFDIFRKKVAGIIGPGSLVKDNQTYGRVPLSYQEALAEYNAIAGNGFTMAYARMYCDYAGIFLMLLAWFIPLQQWYRDRTGGLHQTIYVRLVSSTRLVLSRLAAATGLLMLAAMGLFGWFLGRFISHHGLANIDLVRPFGLIIVWLLPIVIVSSAASSLITILSDKPLAAPAGLISWYLLMLSGSSNIQGNYGWRLVPRHNSLFNEAYYVSHFNQLLLNRLAWLFIGLIITAGAIYLYNRKRTGYHATANKLHLES